MRRSTKIVIASVIILGIAMAFLIFEPPSSGNNSWDMETAAEFMPGSSNGTTFAGGGLRLTPAFVESCENGWTFSTTDNTLATQNWKEWFTEGTGSIAVGSVGEGSSWVKSGKEVSATKNLDLSEFDKILVDIHARSSDIPKEFMRQKIKIDDDLKLRLKDKNLDELGYEIDVAKYGNSTPFTIKVLNNSPHINWPAPTLAVDAIRSKKLESKSGTYETDWKNMGGNVSWENLTIKASLEQDIMNVSVKFQVSNNGETAGNEKNITQIENGTNTYDISNLNGQFARVKVSMSTEDQNKTPALYSIKANA